MLNSQHLSEIRARAEKATRVKDPGDTSIHRADEILALLSEIERLRGLVLEMLPALKQSEWRSDNLNAERIEKLLQ